MYKTHDLPEPGSVFVNADGKRYTVRTWHRARGDDEIRIQCVSESGQHWIDVPLSKFNKTHNPAKEK